MNNPRKNATKFIFTDGICFFYAARLQIVLCIRPYFQLSPSLTNIIGGKSVSHFIRCIQTRKRTLTTFRSD